MSRLGGLADLLADEPALDALLGGRADVVAVPESVRPLAVAAMARRARRLLLLAVPTAAEAERAHHDLAVLLGDEAVELFPSWETLPFERVSPSVETMGRRLRVLWRLRTADAPRLSVVIAPVRALVQRLGPHVEAAEPLIVRPGATVDRDALVDRLVRAGYRREYQTEARGELAVRGSILDVYPSTGDHPLRIDLWGDEVDRLQSFAVADQRATADLDEVRIFPCRELLPTLEVRQRAAALVASEPWGREQWDRFAAGETFDGMEAWLPWLTEAERLLPDFLSDDARVLVAEPARMRDRARELLDEEAALGDSLAKTWGAATDDLPRLTLPFERLLRHTAAPVASLLAAPDSPDTPRVAATRFDPVRGSSDTLSDRIRRLAASGSRVVLAADGRSSADRLVAVLAADGIEAAIVEDGATLAPGTVGVVVAPLEHGVVVPSAGFALVAESDLTGRRRAPRRRRETRRVVDHYDALEPGDFVVHAEHGVGRYAGITTRQLGGVERDYLLLEYRGDDRLYVPTDQVGIVRKYTGGDQPSLNRLGGGEWDKARARVRRAVRDIADELVALYRARRATEGYAFSSDTLWQREMEEAFPYEETPDQQRAIDDVKADMEQPIPMDRLVCGDVGYGKTEIAIRAAFKAVQDGKQVAVLVPTTLLATQHGQTFRERYANYPVRVEVLSRFLTEREQRRVIEDVRAGTVDVVIGTHRLLSDDVSFRSLGLLVVDEEQRFGVQHKERIKRLRTNVDVATLTATPIPRTLELSLTGIRDMSLVNTPPEDRQPILTYVGEYDERAVSEAVRRELLREGQVFFVHNRVRSIEHVATRVRDLVPEARVAVAHGQMDEGSLERVVLDFWERRYDVLVCTTIVESGLDIPTVNTMVVDRADRLGLAQLYQLRGRIGRRGQRAYAYLLHPPEVRLTEEAYERLRTIGELTELGSGFRIAMRDLEIRGAGNLLGAEQSGHIAAVGFDLYCEMVTEAVDELTGRVPEPVPEVSLDIPIDASLPDDYVTRDDVRIEAYRRLAAVEAVADVDDVRREWEDRYGPVPPPAAALLDVARLRVTCVELGVRSLAVHRGMVRVAGFELGAATKARLSVRVPGSVVKGPREFAAPLPRDEAVVPAVIGILGRLVPTGDAPVASGSP